MSPYGVGELSKIIENDSEYDEASVMKRTSRTNLDGKEYDSKDPGGRLNTVAKNTQRNQSYYQTVEDAVKGLHEKNKLAKEIGMR